MLGAVLLALIALIELPAGTLPAPAPENPGVAEPPRANLTGIIVPDDYPAEAIANGEEGTVAVLITVDERGSVSRCEVASSSGSPSLDAQTCAIVFARAKFAPAKDSAGRPVAGEFYQRITWKLEETAPPLATSPELAQLAAKLPKASKPAQPLNRGEVARSMDYPQDAVSQKMEGRSHVRLLVNSGGQVTRCWLVESSGHDVLDAQTCDLFVANARFRPARDRRGNPVASLYDQRLIWRLEGKPGKVPAYWVSRITAILGPEGELRSCKPEVFVEGTWHDGPPETCEKLRERDPQFRRAVREKSKLHDAVVVFENHTLIDPAEIVPSVGRRPGEVLVAVRSTKMKYAPDGKRIECLMMESIGLEGHDDICAKSHDAAFSAPAETGDLRYLTTVYLSGEPE